MSKYNPILLSSKPVHAKSANNDNKNKGKRNLHHANRKPKAWPNSTSSKSSPC